MNEHSIAPAWGRDRRSAPEDIDQDAVYAIQREFEVHGLNVGERALRFCYSAWRADLKSGYRDDKLGTHLFAPCGCNPLRFTATELTDDNKDWQTTYAV